LKSVGGPRVGQHWIKEYMYFQFHLERSNIEAYIYLYIKQFVVSVQLQISIVAMTNRPNKPIDQEYQVIELFIILRH